MVKTGGTPLVRPTNKSIFRVGGKEKKVPEIREERKWKR